MEPFCNGHQSVLMLWLNVKSWLSLLNRSHCLLESIAVLVVELRSFTSISRIAVTVCRKKCSLLQHQTFQLLFA